MNVKMKLPFRSKRLLGQQKVGVPLRFGYAPKRFDWRWIAVVFLTVVTMIIGGLVAYKKLFTIKQVVVQQMVVVRPEVIPMSEFTRAAQQPIGSSIMTFNEQAYVDGLLHRFPTLGGVQVERQYPRTLIVTFEQRVPVCQLVTPTGSFLVDRQGVLFAKAPDDMQGIRLASLTANGAKAQSLGATVSVKGVVLGLQIAKTLHFTTPQLQQMDLHDGQLDVHFSAPPVVYISDDKSPDVAIKTLQVLFDTFARDKRYPNEVDLRYDRPVLRY